MYSGYEKNFPKLFSDGGDSCPLKKVNVKGTIDNTLTTFTIEQTYTNDGKKPIEAIYTFPIPINATLLDMKAHFGERTLQGTVMASNSAKKKYDKAIEDGDAAIMVDEVDAGLYHASFGNLKPGETATIEYRYAMQHTWNDRFLRVALPTTIAPRYGDPADAGLTEAATPEFAMTTDTSWNFTIEVHGKPAQCAISCPNHKFATQVTESGLSLSFATPPDRDVVLELESKERIESVATCGKDTNGWTVAADFMPHIQGGRVPYNLDIVIDCSGSMGGSSIAQAREGLRLIIESLKKEDSFNITAYGSDHRSLFKSRMPVNNETLYQAREFLKGVDADMGGTETGAALSHVYKTDGGNGQRSILLITDGEIWSNKDIYEEAKSSGCRIMTVGVGYAVAEKTLKELAEITGGKSEFVSPEEDMARRIHRHCQRLSQDALGDISIEASGATLIYPEKLQTVYDGDTVHIFATYPEMYTGKITLKASSGEKTYSWDCDIPDEPGKSEPASAISDIARMAVAERLRGMTEKDENVCKKLATDYQLLSKWTSYLLIDVRPDEEKADTLPETVKVRQMLAHDWHDSVACSRAFPSPRSAGSGRVFAQKCCLMMDARPSYQRRRDAFPNPVATFVEDFEIPEFMQKADSDIEKTTLDITQFMEAYSKNCAKARTERKSMNTLADLKALGLPKELVKALKKLISKDLTEEDIVAVLMAHLLDCDSALFCEEAQNWITRCESRLTVSEEQRTKIREAVDSMIAMPA